MTTTFTLNELAAMLSSGIRDAANAAGHSERGRMLNALATDATKIKLALDGLGTAEEQAQPG